MEYIRQVSNGAFRLLLSFSSVVMLKDNSELEYPQCEIRARQHWYPIPHYFL